MSGRGPNHSGTITFRPERKRPYLSQVSTVMGRISRSFSSKDEAETWLRQVTSSLNNAQRSPSLITVADFLKDWLEKRSPYKKSDALGELEAIKAELNGMRSVSPSTYSQQRSILYKHILPLLDPNLMMDQITRRDIEKLFIQFRLNKNRDRQQEKQTPNLDRTLQVMNRLLHKAFISAVSEGLIKDNPATDFHTPYRSPQKTLMTVEQFKSLCQAAKGTRYEALIICSGTIGWRIGEALGAKWADIDWEEGSIKIERQAQRVGILGKTKVRGIIQQGFDMGTAIVFRAPKTAGSVRLLSLGKKTLECLRNHRKAQEYDIIMAHRKWKDNDLIFPTSVGTPMDSDKVLKNYKQLLVKAGIPTSFTFHDLRHFALTQMQSEEVGASPINAQKRAGHSDVKTTMGYTHPIQREDRLAADRLDEYLLKDMELSNPDHILGL
jgi:integrase